MDDALLIGVALAAVAFFAGIVDAIAGGGGLLTVPALLLTGIDTHSVFGTNKGQSVWGALGALVRYARGGLVDRRLAPWLFVSGFTGALGGAAVMLAVHPGVLRPFVLVLLLIAGVAVAFARPVAKATAAIDAKQAIIRAVLISALIGAYDGFFGPGTGTFLLVSFVQFLNKSLVNATADAKVVNFASNLATVILCVIRDAVIWKWVVPMAIAQWLGATLGAHLAVKQGAPLIRKVVLTVVALLVVKLGSDLWR
jgi:uncharacterized membrane protein YfcA